MSVVPLIYVRMVCNKWPGKQLMKIVQVCLLNLEQIYFSLVLFAFLFDLGY